VRRHRREHVIFHDAEDGFCDPQVKAQGHRDIVTVGGHAATISAGELITATEEWINDRTHGQQFKALFLKNSPAALASRTRRQSVSAAAELHQNVGSTMISVQLAR
jgi:exodeoxyribonuclease V alpha subunit